MSRCLVSIGGVVLAIDAHDYSWKFSPGALDERFVIQGAADPQVSIAVGRASSPGPTAVEPIFAAGRPGPALPGWTLSWRADGWTLEANHALSGDVAHRSMWLNADFSRGEVAVTLRPTAQPPFPYPLEHPIDRLLLINYLPAARGGLFHACGVDDQGAGLLFVGPQEAGKSTLARLWSAHSDAAVLSDESVVVRQHEDGWWLYGTPWAGGGQAAYPGRARLRHIFFIAHGAENRLLPVRRLDAVSQLLTESFPTFWDRERMAAMLALCDQIAQGVACHRLEFVPDADVLDFARRAV